MIQTKVSITDNTKKVAVQEALATEMAMAHMGQDVEIIIKSGGRTPLKQGHLRGRTRHERVRPMVWRVLLPVSYAEVQEAGRAGSRVFRNYTTPGTGKGFLRAAVDTVMAKSVQYMREAMRANRL